MFKALCFLCCISTLFTQEIPSKLGLLQHQLKSLDDVIPAFKLEDWYVSNGKTYKDRLVLLEQHPEYKNARTSDGIPFVIYEIMQGGTMIGGGGSTRVFQKLIDLNADITVRGEHGSTVLMDAIAWKASKFIPMLLKQKEIIDLQNNKGETALMYAVHAANYPIIEKLIDAGANLLTKNNAQLTALDIAEQDLLKEIDPFERIHITTVIYGLLDALVEQGNLNINGQDAQGNTRLMRAISSGNDYMVDILLNNFSINMTLINKQGETALALAQRLHQESSSDPQKAKLYQKILDLLTKQPEEKFTDPKAQEFWNTYSKAKPYLILGVDPKADKSEIKNAYNKLALKWHPDKNPTREEDAKKIFQLISKAKNDMFEALSS